VRAVRLRKRRKAKKLLMPMPKRAIEAGSGTASSEKVAAIEPGGIAAPLIVVSDTSE